MLLCVAWSWCDCLRGSVVLLLPVPDASIECSNLNKINRLAIVRNATSCILNGWLILSRGGSRSLFVYLEKFGLFGKHARAKSFIQHAFRTLYKCMCPSSYIQQCILLTFPFDSSSMSTSVRVRFRTIQSDQCNHVIRDSQPHFHNSDFDYWLQFIPTKNVTTTYGWEINTHIRDDWLSHIIYATKWAGAII